MNTYTNKNIVQDRALTTNQQDINPRYPLEDEVNIFDVWKVLVERKKIIYIVTALTTTIAVIYALISPPVYKAEVFFLPPLVADIQHLNIQKIRETKDGIVTNNILNVEVKYVYDLFTQNLSSKLFQQEFFSTYTNLDKSLFNVFLRSLNINLDQKYQRASISFVWHDAQQAADFANEYGRMIEQKTVDQLVSNLLQVISNRISSLSYEIGSKRNMAQQRRNDQIVQLMEELQIASSLKQDTRVSVLQTKIAVLKNRKSNDSFIGGLRDMQEELEMLKSVKMDKTKLRAITVDQPANTPEFRIKPKRKLIVIAGFVLGLIFGVFLVFFINFIETQKAAAK